MKIDTTIKAMKSFLETSDNPVDKRVFEKAIAALEYCEKNNLTYYIEDKHFDERERLDNFIEECLYPTHCKEYKRPDEIDKVIDKLVDFDEYSFYQDNIGKLISYVEELESAINAIAYMIVK